MPVNAARYVPEIDGLRAVAVGSVMLYHLHAALMPGGFTGVDVFFVISGYVVSMSLARDADYSFLQFLQRFYARRVLRIVPALLVCLLVTTAATILFIPSSWLSGTTQKTGLYAFFGMSNFALLSSDSYFSPRPAYNPFTHTWSLAVEEQFYLFYPLILFVSLRLGRSAGLVGVSAKALVSVLCFCSFAALWWVSGISREAAFFMLPYRFWELAAGAICFQLQSGGLRIAPLSARLAAVVGAVLILGTAYWADRQAYPFAWAAPAVLGSLLVIAGVSAGDMSASWVARLLRSQPFVLVGKLSYSLYLWHWPVYVLFRWTVGLDHPVSMAVAVALTFSLAALSYVLVERPIRRGRWVQAQPKALVVVVGLGCVALLWSTAKFAYGTQDRLSASVVMRHRSDWYPDEPQRKADASCRLRWGFEPTGQAFIQSLHGACDPVQWRGHLFVVGDSHATAYSQMLLMLAEQERVDVRIYLQPGCSFANLLSPATARCLPFVRASTDDILQRAAPGDTVFLASLRMPRLIDQSDESPKTIQGIIAQEGSPGEMEERRKALAEANDLIGRFAATGLRVMIDAPKPVFMAEAFRCSDWFNRNNSVCRGGLELPRDELLALRKPVMDSLAALSIDYPDLVTWDPLPALCGRVTCRAVTKQGPLFFDGDHLSNLGNRVLYPHFLAALREVWAKAESGH